MSRMMRKANMIAMLALGLAATMARETPAIGRLVSSAHNVEQNFKQLKTSAMELSPIERLVYSIVLADTQ